MPGCVDMSAVHCGYDRPGGNQWSRRTETGECVRCSGAHACRGCVMFVAQHHTSRRVQLYGYYTTNIALFESLPGNSISSSGVFCCLAGEDDHACLMIGCLWSSFYISESDGRGDVGWDANAAGRPAGWVRFLLPSASLGCRLTSG